MRSVRLLREQQPSSLQKQANGFESDGDSEGTDSEEGAQNAPPFEMPPSGFESGLLDDDADADYEVGRIVENALAADAPIGPLAPSLMTRGAISQGLESVDYLSESKIRELTGQANMKEVLYLEAVVNTQVVSLGGLGHFCPQLEQLKLNNSSIESIRDLGTSLRCLRVLWLNCSGLASLDGLGSLSQTLEELYIAFNHIQDFSPLADDDFEALRILDCDSNEIDDIEQVEFLTSCKRLQAITLDNNPIAALPGYVNAVREALPQLETLDDYPMDTPLQERPSTAMAPRGVEDITLDERQMISESIKLSRLGYDDVEYMVGVKEKSVVSGSSRPGTAAGAAADGESGGSAMQPSSAGMMRRPGTAMSSAMSTACGVPGIARPGTPAAIEVGLARPNTPGVRPGTAGRPGTAMAMRPMTGGAAEVASVYSSSDLTFGSNSALCGGISRALRNRKREVVVDDAKSDKSESPRQESPHEMLWGALRDKDVEQPGQTEIWRRDSRTPEERSPKNAPQCDIMVITHDEEPDEQDSPMQSPVLQVSPGDKASPEVSPSCHNVDPWRAGAEQDEAENASDRESDGSVASRGSWDD